MLCLKSGIKKEHCGFKIRNRNKYLKRSLRAQVIMIWKQKRKRASRLASCEGVATVETALVLPMFLCAVCALMMIAQLLMVEAEIQFSVTETARVCAKQQAVLLCKKHSGEEEESAAHWKQSIPQTLAANVVFQTAFQDSSLCKNCIVGGRTGILVTSVNEKAKGKIYVNASYCLRVPVFFFKEIHFYKKSCATQRVFSGYIPHEGEGEKTDRIVYITENGTVYHTSLSCSHICLHITGKAVIEGLLKANRYKACEKCIQKGTIPAQLYYTMYGDCYHASLSCSGLKRTVKAVKLSEIPGMRMCARCAAKEG